jgi:hypothetical protein
MVMILLLNLVLVAPHALLEEVALHHERLSAETQ